MNTEFTVIGLTDDCTGELHIAGVVPGQAVPALLHTHAKGFSRWYRTFSAADSDHAVRLAHEYEAAEHCEECGEPVDGDGYDGLCGNCADEAERTGRWS